VAGGLGEGPQAIGGCEDKMKEMRCISSSTLGSGAGGRKTKRLWVVIPAG